VDSPYDPHQSDQSQGRATAIAGGTCRQFAVITVQVQQVPPAAVSVTFTVKEGPKIKVGRIKFQGLKHTKTRTLRAAMKNCTLSVFPTRFPGEHFCRTFDSSKLEEDAERVRDALQQHGYFKAVVEDPKTKATRHQQQDSHPPLPEGPGQGDGHYHPSGRRRKVQA